MRLGLVIYGSLETQSGGYLYDRKLVETLRASGDEVEIFSLPWRGYPAHLGQNFSVSVVRRLMAARLDVLLQDELNHPSLFGLNRILRKTVRYPLVSIVHHLRASEEHPPLWLSLYRQVERSYLRTLDGFIFNSQATRRSVDRLLKKPVEGCVVTPAGDRFNVTMTEAEIRARFTASDPLRLLFVGNLIPRKGLNTLLCSLPELYSLDWQLRIAGRPDVDPHTSAGLRRTVIQKGLNGRVAFLGSLSDRQLEDEYRRAHLLAVPSSYEGFGIVYLEGMAFGLPAVGTTAGGGREIIQPGVSGLLVEPGDARQLADGLGQLLADRPRLLEMSLAARKRFDQFPGWEEGMAQARTYLLSVLARRV